MIRKVDRYLSKPSTLGHILIIRSWSAILAVGLLFFIGGLTTFHLTAGGRVCGPGTYVACIPVTKGHFQ